MRPGMTISFTFSIETIVCEIIQLKNFNFKRVNLI